VSDTHKVMSTLILVVVLVLLELIGQLLLCVVVEFYL
jgi:hypothetical protein